MKDCVFCKIVSGELPSTIVHQTESFLVIRDIQPLTKTHCLVLPKKHSADLSSVDAETQAGLLKVVAEAAGKLGLMQFRTVINQGKDAGQTVFHLHAHILGGEKLGGRMGT